MDKINNHNLYNKPFKHLIIENILEEEEIKHLKNNFPDNKLFNKFNRRNDKTEERYVLYVDKKEDFNKLKNKDFWLSLYKKFNNKKFLKNVFQLLGKNLPEKESHLQMQLIYDIQNYEILPHCDTKLNSDTKFLTMLFYLNEDETLDLGTELYIPDENGNIKIEEKNDIKKFNIYKKAPFKINNLLIFIPEYGKSWHGVSKIKKNVIRKTIQIFLKNKKTINYDTI